MVLKATIQPNSFRFPMKSELSRLLSKKLAFLRTGKGDVGLHDPHFEQGDSDLLSQVLQSGYVSTAGTELAAFKAGLTNKLGVQHLQLTTSGTSALSAALVAVGVKPGDEVILPSLTFAATAHAILHAGASPIFADIEERSLGLCPSKLRDFLSKECRLHQQGGLVNKRTGARISCIVVVHVLGGEAASLDLRRLADDFDLRLVEDAAESFGSTSADGRPLGTLGDAGITSFNGNKIITTGQGGAVFTNSAGVAQELTRIVGTGKVEHAWKFAHNYPGKNLRMPNINASLGVAQLQRFEMIMSTKARIHQKYKELFGPQITLFEPMNSDGWNHWLTTISLPTLRWEEICNEILDPLTASGVGVRPLWKPLHLNPHLSSFQRLSTLSNAERVAQQLLSLPSGVGVLKLMG